YLVEPFLNTQTILGIFIQAAIAGTAGLLVYIGLTKWLQLQEGENIVRMLLRGLRFLKITRIE
ncbi:MAG: hypothetical protein M3Q64_02510, partial [bacterium]|nr:hypothetical protein [bacterium]